MVTRTIKKRPRKTAAGTTPKTTPVAKKASTEKVKEVSAKRTRTPVAKHEVECAYAGPSVPFNVSRSKTRLPVEKFGTLPEQQLTTRSIDMLRALYSTYKTKPFARKNADAAVLKYAGWKGWLEHVEGDPASEGCMLRFTEQAFQESH